ncbi:MAG: ABC transporter ATP-binding protein [Natronomonas sp.]
MQITVEDVHKTYGDVTALDGLSLEIPDGSSVGILGTNGAGKSTLFKLLVGLDRPDDGSLTVGGRSIADAGRSIREHVGYLPERVGFPGALTGREVLEFDAQMRGLPRDDRIADTIELVGLTESAADRPVDGYSNGMRRRLGLGVAILSDPGVLILDEPTAGLDPRGVREFHGIVERVRSETGATVVLASHVLSEVERVCDRVAVLHRGRLLTDGPVDALVDGEMVTVRLVPVDDADTEAIASVGEGYGSVTISTRAVSVRCPSADVPRLFAKLGGTIEIETTDVDRDGLEVAFHDAIEGVGA